MLRVESDGESVNLLYIYEPSSTRYPLNQLERLDHRTTTSTSTQLVLQLSSLSLKFLYWHDAWSAPRIGSVPRSNSSWCNGVQVDGTWASRTIHILVLLPEYYNALLVYTYCDCQVLRARASPAFILYRDRTADSKGTEPPNINIQSNSFSGQMNGELSG